MALIKERTRLLNRSKTQSLAILKRQSKARLEQIKRQLTELEEALLDLARQCPKRARAFDILYSIPGLGRVTAVAILVKCPEIGTIARKQIASLAGLAPMARQSGQWRGKAFIQGGRKLLRDALYMPALVAARYNPDLRQKYQAVISQGKPAKVALTAFMRKLIELANTLVQKIPRMDAKKSLIETITPGGRARRTNQATLWRGPHYYPTRRPKNRPPAL